MSTTGRTEFGPMFAAVVSSLALLFLLAAPASAYQIGSRTSLVRNRVIGLTSVSLHGEFGAWKSLDEGPGGYTIGIGAASHTVLENSLTLDIQYRYVVRKNDKDENSHLTRANHLSGRVLVGIPVWVSRKKVRVTLRERAGSIQYTSSSRMRSTFGLWLVPGLRIDHISSSFQGAGSLGLRFGRLTHVLATEVRNRMNTTLFHKGWWIEAGMTFHIPKNRPGVYAELIYNWTGSLGFYLRPGLFIEYLPALGDSAQPGPGPVSFNRLQPVSTFAGGLLVQMGWTFQH